MHRATCNLYWFVAVLGPRAGARACDVQGSVQELVQGPVQELVQVCSVASPHQSGHFVHVCRILLLYCAQRFDLTR